MKTPTSQLEGKALDYAAAYAANGKSVFFDAFGLKTCGRSIKEMVADGLINPSQDWAQAGKLIEAYRVDLICECAGLWHGETCDENGINNEPYTGQYGNTPIKAAMRAIVQLELGSDFDVPEEMEVVE